MSETNASAARQEPRYNVEITAFFEGFGTKPQEGKVVDVSNRGLYLEIEDLPTQKSFGSCRLNLPNSEETLALGICVVRVKPPREDRPAVLAYNSLEMMIERYDSGMISSMA